MDYNTFINKLINTDDISNNKNFICIDFKRHYENVLKDLKYDIPVPSCFDNAIEYKGGKLNNRCYYYVETKNYFPFKKNIWYSFEF